MYSMWNIPYPTSPVFSAKIFKILFLHGWNSWPLTHEKPSLWHGCYSCHILQTFVAYQDWSNRNHEHDFDRVRSIRLPVSSAKLPTPQVNRLLAKTHTPKPSAPIWCTIVLSGSQTWDRIYCNTLPSLKTTTHFYFYFANFAPKHVIGTPAEYRIIQTNALEWNVISY